VPTADAQQLPHPVEKRSASIAIINMVGNLAQIYAPYFYLPQNGPRYLTAMTTNVLFCAACILATLALRRCLATENWRLAVHGAEDETEDGLTKEDNGFRYVL
jgi:hypothetical protein